MTKDEEKVQYTQAVIDIFWDLFHKKFEDDKLGKSDMDGNLIPGKPVTTIVNTYNMIVELKKKGLTFDRGRALFHDSFWMHHICIERFSFYPDQNPNYKKTKVRFKKEMSKYGWTFKYQRSGVFAGWVLDKL